MVIYRDILVIFDKLMNDEDRCGQGTNQNKRGNPFV